MKPPEFPRRILLMTLGTSPAVVTETVHALAVGPLQRGEAAFVPTEIHLLTTREGLRQAALTLMDPQSGALTSLCRDYGLDRSAMRFGEDTIHVIGGDQGQPLDDIRTVDDNNSAADSIIQQVRLLTAGDDSALHVSLAGGRKTMGFYLGYALSLFGRPQDRLSHVLVPPEFERAEGFFYPTPESRFLRCGDKRTVDAREARVTLAQIEFVSLRGRLGADMLGDPSAGYRDIVHRARNVLDDATLPQLQLDFSRHVAICGGHEVRFAPATFAWYAWFALQAKLGKPKFQWRHADVESLAEVASSLKGPHAGRAAVESWLTPDGGLDEDAFHRQVTRINNTLRQTLGPGPAACCRVSKTGKRSASQYGLDLKPEQIEKIR